MSKLEQAARQALDVDEALVTLELILKDGAEYGNWPLNKNCEDGLKTITALREALMESNISEHKLEQQAEQEPVAWWNGKETAWFEHELCGHPAPDGCTIPLYAAPVRTKDLTDDEIFEILELQNCPKSELKYWFHDARAVIAADREKNK